MDKGRTNLAPAFITFMTINIKNLTLQELEIHLQKEKIPAFHAKQIFRWIYQKRVNDFNQMTDLSKGVRELLPRHFSLSELSLLKKEISRDGTAKFALQLSDKNIIECVLIPSEKRKTICLSSQVGCKFNCAFCQSAQGGFVRNLETWEIVDQLLLAEKLAKEEITHIVFMGIGEPMDNYHNVLKAVRIFNTKHGLNIGARRITISTSGVIEGIKKLETENLQIELSVSLHSAVDEIRSKLMPINKKYPLDKLILVLKDYYKNTKRQITFEYVLLKDINVDQRSIDALAELTRGFDCKINFIPYNGSFKGLQPPDAKAIKNLMLNLEKKKVLFTLRKSRGLDINAACGQLRWKYLNQ